MKKLTCRDIGVDCDVEFVGETDDEIMAKASEHAKKEHNLPVIPQNIEEKCRGAICEVNVDDVQTNNDGGGDDVGGNDDEKDEDKEEV